MKEKVKLKPKRERDTHTQRSAIFPLVEFINRKMTKMKHEFGKQVGLDRICMFYGQTNATGLFQY